MTATIEQTTEVQVPIETAYNQWTQFRSTGHGGVEAVKQLDDRRLHWVAEFDGERHEWPRRSSSSIQRSASPGATPTARTTRGS